MAAKAELPVVDLSSSDRASTAESIRKACLEHGFFYLINHGVEESMIDGVFEESKKFFSLPLHEKMRLERNEDHRGYTPSFSETLDASLGYRGDLKESFYIGPTNNKYKNGQNQWPSQEFVPLWRETMESYHQKALSVGRTLITLIALALNLDENFFEKVGAIQEPMAFVRLLHYPGNLGTSNSEFYGASAHSDYGMITLLMTDGVPGLQICREKDKLPQVWEDVPHLQKAFIINVGDMLERWTNCLFRSTLHRVLATGQERYSVAFFLDPNADCLVECLESCCSEACPPRFPPIRSIDYLKERFSVTYASK